MTLFPTAISDAQSSRESWPHNRFLPPSTSIGLPFSLSTLLSHACESTRLFHKGRVRLCPPTSASSSTSTHSASPGYARVPQFSRIRYYHLYSPRTLLFRRHSRELANVGSIPLILAAGPSIVVATRKLSATSLHFAGWRCASCRDAAAARPWHWYQGLRQG